jgi:hypothetical protein
LKSPFRRGHARFVEMPSVAKEVRGGFHREVAPPLERTDGKAAVLVHDPGREGRRRPVDGRTQIGVEEPHAQLGHLRVADVDRGEADIACRDRDRVDRLLAVNRRQSNHVDEVRHHQVFEPCPGAVDLVDDLV